MTSDFSLSRILASLPPGSQPLVQALRKSARAAGSHLYLVGGPVRDLLLERPIRDLDLLVVPGTETIRIARAAAPEEARIVEYGRFGTLRIETTDLALDLAGARSETYSRPGALPTVEPGSLEEDLLRRDFSANALAIALDSSGGKSALPVVDVCGGLADLRAGNLRVLHPRSFHDDPTRILRAARLAPRLGFKLARATRSALRDALRDGAMGAVSGDRLRRELEKLFADASLGLDPSLALRNLDHWHVLGALEPGFEWPKAAVAPIRRLGRAIADPQWRQNRNRPWVSGLAVWLAPLRPALRRRVLQRFAIRGEAADRIANFARERDRLLGGLAKARGRGAVDALLGGIHEESLLALFASSQPLVRGRVLRWAAEDRARRAPLSGEDLVAMGLEGPSVGKVLARIRIAHLDGAIANREEAAALAVEWVRRRGANPQPRRKK
ncbi:MAG TPA: CCA tRNA nucleotidyltransferase [Myxococcales bacterium]|nr:CCA tRNA nucleotidyltransferase [Myxococcales bacterium]